MNKLKLILIGFGRMGQEIRKIAERRGHEVILTIDQNNQEQFTEDNLKKADAAIEFTFPDAAYENIMKCLKAGLPVVSGTTGWLGKFNDVQQYVNENQGSFFYASNYNIGVNLFFKVSSHLSKMMNNYDNYDVEIEETHHIHKLDAPSGTAVTLAEEILKNVERKQRWVKEKAEKSDDMAVRSIREDEVPGIHKVFYTSGFDEIEIKHSAKSREGFAIGAVMAAEFLHDKKGLFSMDDLLNI